MTPRAPDESSSTGEEVPPRRLLLVSGPAGVVALPAEPVVEVIPSRPYARLPGAPECVAGLANRRGQLVTVVDLGLALGADAAVADPDHRIVIVAFRGMELGLAVRDVLRFTEEQPGGAAGDAPANAEAANPGAVRRDGEGILRVLELESLLAPHFGGDIGRGGEPSSERP